MLPLSPQIYLHSGLESPKPGDRVLPLLWYSAAVRHTAPGRHQSGLQSPIPRWRDHKTKKTTFVLLFFKNIVYKYLFLELAGVCLENLQLSLRSGGRRSIPSQMEMEAIMVSLLQTETSKSAYVKVFPFVFNFMRSTSAVWKNISSSSHWAARRSQLPRQDTQLHCKFLHVS